MYLVLPNKLDTKKFILYIHYAYLTLVVLFFLLTINVKADTNTAIYTQVPDGGLIIEANSQYWQALNINKEATDDFYVIGTVERVWANAWMPGFPQFQGVYVRFYESVNNQPGALQYERFLAVSDPNLRRSGAQLDIILPAPFAATGRHYISIQPLFDAPWYWTTANNGTSSATPFCYRNLNVTTAWTCSFNSDLGFTLYGTVTGAPQIISLSATTATRSEYIEIYGSNMGGNGTVLIDSLPAPYTNWSDTKIIAYVPESARLGAMPVQVTTSGGNSNTVTLNVTARQPQARVRWRIRLDGVYAGDRPVIAPDGTVYVIDIYGHLYSLTPDGGLKWIARGAGIRVTVGQDGTVYSGDENFVKAFNPDGTLKWTFTQNPRAFIFLGMSVGPDGNIYGVATHGIGVFCLRPDGTLKWTTPELYNRPIVSYGEVVFGPNGNQQQLYFGANSHIRAVRISDSSTAFQFGGSAQPVVSPFDATIHFTTTAYSPSGTLLWNSQIFASTTPTIDTNGVHYVIGSGNILYAVNPNGSVRNQATLADNSYYGDASISPNNSTLVISGGPGNVASPNFIVGVNPTDGREMWRLTLPQEGGLFLYKSLRPAFTPDSHTAFVTTNNAGTNARSYLYAIDVSATQNQYPIAAASVDRNNGPAPLTVNFSSAGSRDPDGAIVAYNWVFGDGTTSTEANPRHIFTNPGNYTATLTVTDNQGATASSSVAVVATQGGCTQNCIRSARITFFTKRVIGGVTVTANVYVTDELNRPLHSVSVSVLWTLPTGTTITQTFVSDGSGYARPFVTSKKGTYTIQITDMSRVGYTFDPANSVLTASTTR